METLDYDYTIHSTPGKGDDTLLVKFFTAPVQDMKASEAAGRPIFKDVEWIDIRIPGNRDNVVNRPTRPTDLTRFPRHYAAFKARDSATEKVVGTLLDQWTWRGMTRARVEELKHFNIRTVEQLANASDAVALNFHGFQEMKLAANRYLAVANENAPLEKLSAEIAALAAQNAKLSDELAQLKKPKAKRKR